MAVLPPLVAELVANNSEFMAKMAESKGATEDLASGGSSNFSRLSSLGGAALLGLAGAAAIVGGASIDLAQKFQSTTTQIAANAGISTDAAAKIGKAFLGTAGTTIYSGQQ